VARQGPEDITILRSDRSVSRSLSSEGSGEADPPRVLKQRFVLDEKLGSGGMGTAFRAKDLRKVEARDRQPFLAIKVLNNDFKEHPEAFIALQREAAKSQSLSHPNIVTIYDFDKDGDVPFMTMELLEGHELAELLRSYPNGLPDPMAWDVIKGICAGLSYAHQAGIVHADFKPGNVYVAPDNAPKILDFGIARAVQLTESHGEETLFDPSRLAALTPAYASREMLKGDNPEPRDDLYSLGIVIYLILTGHHPYGRLSADDAAREGLKAEKPKRINRRQWQVIARCLSFSRQDRPANVGEIEKFLLQPSPWRSRSAMAAVAAFTLALSVSYLVDDAELAEVKQEVRQTTLVDAQLDRLTALIGDPVFDSAWQQLMANEFEVLKGLQDTESTAKAVADQIRAVYTQRIRSLENLDQALALLVHGEAFGRLPEARLAIERKANERVRELLDYASSELRWLTELQQNLSRLKLAFPENPEAAELDLEAAEVLEVLVVEALQSQRVGEAEMILSELQPRLFDAVMLDHLQGLIVAERKRMTVEFEARQIAMAALRHEEALDELLSASCLRLDLDKLQAHVPPSSSDSSTSLSRIAVRIGECLTRLTEVDADRAFALQRKAQQLFGASILAEANASVDPCALTYLVGNGTQVGRRGYCADQISEQQTGPRLVVVPTADGSSRFAMSKQETSWAEFMQFCGARNRDLGRGLCPEVELEQSGFDERLPVTGISLAVVQAYADWLSETTGYTYRLPTASEWYWAAQGEPDPNRNCRVQLDGVQRGLSPIATNNGLGNDFGLVHMLGNVQEWVVDDGELSAVGGSFSDPIRDCVVGTARTHAGEPTEDTGFRLVREVS
jgi:hypothetical protein